jgi:hypothetical protein
MPAATSHEEGGNKEEKVGEKARHSLQMIDIIG